MSYNEFINNILETRGRFACGDEYHERHHIVPRCMGGADDKENLIDLFAREHFEAHRLLALENPDNDKLTYAWWMMAHCQANNQDRYELTAEEYEEAKIAASKKQGEAQRKRMSSLETRKRISESLTGRYVGDKNPNYGKHLSESAKEKISKANKGKSAGENNYFYNVHMCGEDNPFYGRKHTQESRRKMSESLKGRTLSEEHKQKMRDAFSGEGNPMYGKHHSEETKNKIRKSSQKLWQDNEFRTKIIEHHKIAYKGDGNPNSKIVLQYDKNMKFLKIFKFKKQASDELNINASAISMCCLNRRKTAGGFKWRYLYDQIKKDGTIVLGAISLGFITEEEALKQLG